MKPSRTVLTVASILLTLSLFYSIVRLSYFPVVRYHRIVISHLEKDDLEHIKRHQETMAKFNREAFKGLVVFLCSLGAGSYLIHSAKSMVK